MRTTRPYTYLSTVQGMCRRCRGTVPCRIIEEKGRVYQERLCPTCGLSRALVAESADWYAAVIGRTVKCAEISGARSRVRRGCPRDCGPCGFHANACHLPVFSITNQCNMRCPICFTYNRADKPYFMSKDEIGKLMDGVIARTGHLDLVNLTGGEPTLHPELLSLVAECKRPEVGRVTVNSNGIRLSTDEALVSELARLGAYVILSFHTLRPDRSMIIHGEDVVATKLRALENLKCRGVGTTLLYVMIRDVNDDEAGGIVRLARENDNVRSITVQTMTFTGRGGRDFAPAARMPLDGAARAFETATAGEMRAEHFFPHPGAHPLCYSVAYYLKCDGGLVSFTEFFSVNELREMLMGSYLLRPDDRFEERFRRALDGLWARGGSEETLRSLKRLIERLYPADRQLSASERQRLAEESILTVYLHSHMDEDTLDVSRLVVCPDQVPDADGRMIPACAYNIFYRMMDERFYVPGDGADAGEAR